jgi:DNA-binding NarL/FixJ family response regulator
MVLQCRFFMIQLIDMTRILLADDHKIVRQGVRRLLEDIDGFKIVGEAADGVSALEMVTELKPDILVTDLRMPKMSGIEVTRKVKELYPEIKVLVLSMYGAEAYVYSALSAGASGYVLKDSGIHNLDDAIHRIILGGRYLSPPITRKKVEAYCARNRKPELTW